MNLKRFVSFTLVFVMLLSSALSVFADGITMHLNGNEITGDKEFSVDNGVFSAETTGSGLFALAMYKNNELAKLQFAQGEDLSSARLNMVVDSDSSYYDDIKIFRFDSDGTPICVNKILKPGSSEELRIYANHTFGDAGKYSKSENRIVSDGIMELIAYSDSTSYSNVRFGIIAPHLEKYVVYEADYKLGTRELSGNDQFMRLVGLYYDKPTNDDSPYTLVRLSGSKISTGGNLYSDKWTKISLVLNIEKNTYDVYVDRKPMKENLELFPADIVDSRYGSRGFFIGQTSSDTKYWCDLFVDNIQIYGIDSPDDFEFLDLGDRIPNVHNTDYSKYNTDWNTEIYERPSAADIAKKTIESGHPRVMINSDRIQELINSDNPNIVSWREAIIEKADNAPDSFDYDIEDETLANIPECLDMMMNLGLAYQFTGNMKYPERAYKEAEVLMNLVTYHENSKVWLKDWNSDSYLDVGEISVIMSVCYDWMYDAWTREQKKVMSEAVMANSIDLSYKALYNEYINNGGNTGTSWYRSTNNWNAVCNGGVLTAALAFMEEDIHKCSQLAEATIRGFEYMLPDYYPDGAWTEGASYWAYALKYLTIACSTLENSCGTLYGLDKTPGLERTQTYSLDLEGKTGVFGFGDGGAGHVKAPYMFYWSKVFDNAAITNAAMYAMEEFSFAPNAFDLIYYHPEYDTNIRQRELFSYREGTETVTIASGHEKTDTMLAITGGEGVATSHDHLDSGSIILDINGFRLIGDTGAEHYDAAQYFSTNRYWYYKARPEGHNVYVINPQNLYDTDGSYYHGQSKTAISEASLDTHTGKAVMDLSAAYARDASNATRTMYLDGKKAVIEDEITLTSDGNLVEWYYHFKDILSYVVDGSTKYNSDNSYCTVTSDGNSVIIKYRDYTVENGRIVFADTYKSFRVSFETDSDCKIEIRDAGRNPYDASVVEGFRKAGTMSYDYYTYYRGPEYSSTDHYEKNGNTYPMDKIVVKMENVPQITVKLKTIIEVID